jgi:hypothetical protein
LGVKGFLFISFFEVYCGFLLNLTTNVNSICCILSNERLLADFERKVLKFLKGNSGPLYCHV